MMSWRTGSVLLAAALVLACCTSFGKKQPTQVVDPNAYPANYRKQIAGYLVMELKDRADFYNASISAPALKPIGDSQRYIVCIRYNGHIPAKEKMFIYFAGALQQYIDATPAECGDALYQPFSELAAIAPK
jgi:hypothetical protein